MLIDVFGFAEHQEKATYGLGYNSILTGSSDKSVLNKGNSINIGETKINVIECYVRNIQPVFHNKTFSLIRF